MTWSKLSDDFSDDAWTLSDEAFRLHTEGLIWSNRKLLDCVIPKDDLRRFAKRPEAVQELLKEGFWLDSGDTYTIRHHAQYQRLREAVLKQQEANQSNAKKGGRPKGPAREQKSRSVSESQSQSNTVGFCTSPAVSDFPVRINTGQETESVNKPVYGSDTKRDRPGIQGFTPAKDFEVPRMTPEEDVAWLQGAPVLAGGNSKSFCSVHRDAYVPVACEECREVLHNKNPHRWGHTVTPE